MHVIFAMYLQSVTTLPCKMANNYKVIIYLCTLKIKCTIDINYVISIEQLTVN